MTRVEIADHVRAAFALGPATRRAPNQISNILAFPGVLRGALDDRVTRITPAMKLAACDALSALGAEQRRLLPSVLDPDVVSAVAARVLAAARADTADPSLAFLETIEVAP